MAEIVALDDMTGDMSPDPVRAGVVSKDTALKGESSGPCRRPDINVKELAIIVSLTAIALTIIIVVGSMASCKGPEAAASTAAEVASGVSITHGTGFLWYPTLDVAKYVIHFNLTTRQANYAAYIVPPIVANSSATVYHSDTYGLNVLPDGCYNQGGVYQQSHLVPRAAFGRDTDYMANAVPMNSSLNTGVWRAVRDNMRKRFGGKLAVIGCEYSGVRIPDSLPLDGCSDVYRPEGCYYIVLDISPEESVAHPPTVLERLSDARPLLASGYYPNLGFSACEKRLPYWVSYQGAPPQNQCG